MLNKQERIAKLKQQAAEFLKQAENIEVGEAKRLADQRRKADAAAKLLLGAGVLQLDPPDQARTVAAVLERLSPRDRSRVESWAINRDLDLAAVQPQSSDFTTPTLDPEAAALKRVIRMLDDGGLSLLSTEFLSVAQGEDRAVLERLFATLGERKNSNT